MFQLCHKITTKLYLPCASFLVSFYRNLWNSIDIQDISLKIRKILMKWVSCFAFTFHLWHSHIVREFFFFGVRKGFLSFPFLYVFMPFSVSHWAYLCIFLVFYPRAFIPYILTLVLFSFYDSMTTQKMLINNARWCFLGELFCFKFFRQQKMFVCKKGGENISKKASSGDKSLQSALLSVFNGGGFTKNFKQRLLVMKMCLRIIFEKT